MILRQWIRQSKVHVLKLLILHLHYFTCIAQIDIPGTFHYYEVIYEMPPKILPASWVRNQERISCSNSLEVSVLELSLCLRHACKLRCCVLILRWRTNLAWQLSLEPFFIFHDIYHIFLSPIILDHLFLLYFGPIFCNCLLDGMIIWKKYIWHKILFWFWLW